MFRLVNVHVGVLLETHEVENWGLDLSCDAYIHLQVWGSVNLLTFVIWPPRTPLSRQIGLLVPKHSPCFLHNAYAYAVHLHLGLWKLCTSLRSILNTAFFLKPFLTSLSLSNFLLNPWSKYIFIHVCIFIFSCAVCLLYENISAMRVETSFGLEVLEPGLVSQV